MRRLLLAAMLFCGCRMFAANPTFNSFPANQFNANVTSNTVSLISGAAFDFLTDAAGGNTSVIVSNAPIGFNGQFSLLRSNFISGHSVRVFTNLVNYGTNFLNQNDPDEYDGYGPAWSLGITNDSGLANTMILVTAGAPNVPNNLAYWDDGAGAPNNIYSHYTFGVATMGTLDIPTNKPTGTVRFVDERNGDDAWDGISIHSPFKSIYRAYTSIGTNSTIYLLPGDYSGQFQVLSNGYTIVGIGNVRVTNTFTALFGGTFKNIQFMKQIGGHTPAGQMLTFENCEIGNFDPGTIDAIYYDIFDGGTLVCRNCRLKSNFDTINPGTSGAIILETCTLEAIAYSTNNNPQKVVRGLCIRTNVTAYVTGCKIVASNGFSASLSLTEATNCGILLQKGGRLFLGQTSIQVSGTNIAPIAYIDGATSDQVTYLDAPVTAGGATPVTITFPNSTVNWTNTTGARIQLHIDNTGVTATVTKKNGTQIGAVPAIGMTLDLLPGDYFSETYSVGTPSGKYFIIQ